MPTKKDEEQKSVAVSLRLNRAEVAEEEKVTIPPSSEPRVFGHIWPANIRINTPSHTEGSCVITHYPYNNDTKEILIKGHSPVYTRVNGLWEAAEEIPELEQALQSLYDAIPLLIEWQRQKENPPTPASPDEDSSDEESQRT